MTLVLFIHADPSVRHLYEAALDAAGSGTRELVFVNKGGFSSAYQAYGNRLRAGPGTLLEALAYDAAGTRLDRYGSVVLCTFSAGYALAREILAEPESRVQLDGYVAIDSYHAATAPDGNPLEQHLAGLVAYARSGKVCWVGHSDVKTYGYESTTDVAEALRAAVGEGLGAFRVQAFDVRKSDRDEHIAALREWGPGWLAGAVAEVQSRTVRDTPTPTTRRQTPAALSRDELVPDTEPSPALEASPWGMRALVWSLTQLGVSEANRGEQKVIEGYHAEVGGKGWLTYRHAWCASFASAACKRTQQPGDPEPPHALTFRVRDLWTSAIERRTAVPIKEVRRDPKRYLQPGNLLCMSRGALPVDGSIAADGHVTRIEAYGGGQVGCVDGNKGDMVQRWEYELADPHIVGVVLYPGGESINTWDPPEWQLDAMIAMAERAFEDRGGAA